MKDGIKRDKGADKNHKKIIQKVMIFLLMVIIFVSCFFVMMISHHSMPEDGTQDAFQDTCASLQLQAICCLFFIHSYEMFCLCSSVNLHIHL